MILAVSRKTIFPRRSPSRDRSTSGATSATITTLPPTPPAGVDGDHPNDATFSGRDKGAIIPPLPVPRSPPAATPTASRRPVSLPSLPHYPPPPALPPH